MRVNAARSDAARSDSAARGWLVLVGVGSFRFVKASQSYSTC